MTDPHRKRERREREDEIRAGAAGGRVPADDLVAAARYIRAALLRTVPEAHPRDVAALLDATTAARRASSPHVRAAVGLVAALVAAGSLAAGMTGALPVLLQDALHRSGELVGIHLPGSDDIGDVDLDPPTDRPLWDDGHHPDEPADGHAHTS